MALIDFEITKNLCKYLASVHYSDWSKPNFQWELIRTNPRSEWFEFRKRKYRALFQETVRKFLENKVITHNSTEFITPEGSIFNIPIHIQFVNLPPIPEERKIRELTNSDKFSKFFDRVLDNAEKDIKELTRRRHKELTGIDLVDIDTEMQVLPVTW